jgi:hypothetical protein
MPSPGSVEYMRARQKAISYQFQMSQEFLNYVDANGANQRAKLENITRGLAGYPDPDWLVYSSTDVFLGQSDKLRYLVWDRSIWWANPQSHESVWNDRPPSIDFKHTRESATGDNHMDTAIGFVGWDGKNYIAYVIPIYISLSN